jgi:hypothetical protein
MCLIWHVCGKEVLKKFARGNQINMTRPLVVDKKRIPKNGMFIFYLSGTEVKVDIKFMIVALTHFYWECLIRSAGNFSSDCDFHVTNYFFVTLANILRLPKSPFSL